MFPNFKRSKNHEDGSDFDDFWTKTIATTNFFFENFRAAEIFASPKKFRDERANAHTNERTTERPSRDASPRIVGRVQLTYYELSFPKRGLMESHCFKSHSFKIGPPASAASTFVFLTIFGRTDLRISLSKAKFDPEADFDVCFAVAPQKRYEKLIFRSKNFRKVFFSASKKEMLGIV